MQICVSRQVLSVSQADDRNVVPRDSPAASDDSFELIPDEEEGGVQLASADGAQPLCGVQPLCGAVPSRWECRAKRKDGRAAAARVAYDGGVL